MASTTQKLPEESVLNPDKRPIVTAIINAYIKAKERGWDRWYWAWDLHDTIMKSTYSHADIPRSMYPDAPECLQKLSARKDTWLIMYTSSKEEHLPEYKKFFTTNGIKFDSVNENPAESSNGYASFQQKFYFSVLADDKAGFDPKLDFKAIMHVLDYLPELTGTEKVFDVVATVARMHSPKGPHEGHQALITEMFNRGKQVMIFLACDYVPSERNPLSYDDRHYLLTETIKELGFGERDYSIYPLQNREDNDHWSEFLDQQILLHHQKPNASEQAIALFHSRDGFGKHYEPHGRFPMLYVTEVEGVSATSIREEVKTYKSTHPAYFWGKVKQQFAQSTGILNQVRAIIRNQKGDYLVIKYKGERGPAYRFPGGYFNPAKDKSHAECLKRKLTEKISGAFDEHADILGIVPVTDWRYREAGTSIHCVVYETRSLEEHGPTANTTYRKLPAIDSVLWVPQEQLGEFLHKEEHPILQLLT